MNNGIRLNNFENGINEILKNQISISQNDINIYNDLFDLEFNIIFNNDVKLKNVDKTIQGLAFKNIIDRINLVIVKDDNNLNTYYFYDKKVFNEENFIDNLQLQDNKFRNILNNYLSKFISLNNTTTIKRNLFFEIEIYVFENNILYNLLDYVNKNSTSNNLISLLNNEAIRYINALIYQYENISITQYWLPFINPEKYCYNDNVINETTFNFYCSIIESVYKTQKSAVQYSVGLIGPNININNKDFLDKIFERNLDEKFEAYSFYYEDTNSNLYQDDKFNYNDVLSSIRTIQNHDNSKNIFFTNQGISLNPNLNELDEDYDKLNKIGYEEISNDFSLYKEGVYTFKNKLISCNEDKHGLIYYNDVDGIDFNPSLQKSYSLYKRINDFTINYNYLVDDIQIAEGSYNQINLYDNENQTDIVYILWSDNYSEDVILTSHYARTYYGLNEDGQSISIDLTNAISVSFEYNNGFIIVIENNILSSSELSFLRNKMQKIIGHFRNTIEHLINVLPDSYNKEVIETNFYKLLRAIGLEIGEYKFNLEEIKNGFYLNALDKNEDYLQEVKEDLIYQNFGSLIDLPKKEKWSYEQYRRMVTAIINVLLKGPNKENISNAIEEFTGYKNDIYELYQERNNPMFSSLSDLNLTFRFATVIKKDLDKYDDANELMDNLMYLLNIIKPAQALFIIYVLLEEWEDSLEFVRNTLDILDVDSTFNFRETKFGLDLSDTFELFVNKDERNKLLINDENLTEDTLNNLQNGYKPYYKKLAMPIYKVTDEYNVEFNVDFAEQYDITIKDIIKSYNAIKLMENYHYITDDNNNIMFDENNNPISRIQDEMKMYSNNNLSEILSGNIETSDTFEVHKIVSNYKKNIYFPNSELTFKLDNRDNIKVFLNGVLLAYNSYEYINYSGRYANGIKLNDNIFEFKDEDIITILYIKVGNYNENAGIQIIDEVNIESTIEQKEQVEFIKPLGFKLLGNSRNLPPDEIYTLYSGQLTNLNYILLETLQDKCNAKLIIDMNKRGQRPLTETELYYIEQMRNDYYIDVEIING